MKKLSSLIVLVIVLVLVVDPPPIHAAGSTEQPVSLANGLHLTGKTTDRWSLAADTVAPTAQSAATVTAWKALQDHGAIATGSDYSVQHATVSVSAAELIAMYTTPKLLLAAPGAGKSILVTKFALTTTRTSTAFTGGGAAIVQYGSTANGGGTQALDSTVAATVITGAAGTTVTARNGAVISDLAAASIQNAGLYLSNATAVFAAGTGTATADVWYVVY